GIAGDRLLLPGAGGRFSGPTRGGKGMNLPDLPELLAKTKSYLICREEGEGASQDLEAAWSTFYIHYSRKIRSYAFRCGAAAEEVGDCIQEVWRELLVRLPTFDLDPLRGQFDTWLFRIVQGKAADLRRTRERGSLQGNLDALQSVAEDCPGPDCALEEEE